MQNAHVWALVGVGAYLLHRWHTVEGQLAGALDSRDALSLSISKHLSRALAGRYAAEVLSCATGRLRLGIRTNQGQMAEYVPTRRFVAHFVHSRADFYDLVLRAVKNLDGAEKGKRGATATVSNIAGS